MPPGSLPVIASAMSELKLSELPGCGRSQSAMPKKIEPVAMVVTIGCSRP